MSRILLRRDKSLKEMSFREIMLWLKKLVDMWDVEYASMSTGIFELEKEIERTMKEILKKMKGGNYK